MASKLPAVKNSAYTFRCVLFAQDTNQIKSNPTIAAGDWKVSTDGAAFANLTTLPDVDPDSSVQVLVSLSAGEMNGDEIMITAIDASGAEWHSAAWVIHTAGQTLDTIEGLVDELESRLTATRAAYLDKLNVSGTLAHSDAAATYKADVSALALEATAQSILTDTAEIGAAGAGLTAADDAVIAAIGTLNNLSSAQAQSAAAAALTAYGAATAAGIPSAGSVADAVWDEATAGHATAGSTGAALTAAGNAGDPWSTALPGAYAAGTAGAIVGGWDDSVFVAVATASAVNGSNLSIHRGDTFTASITGLGDIQARTQLYWTVKEHVNQSDAKAAVQVEEDAGLMVLKGAAATAGDGDITVTNAVTGAITLTLAADATAELTPGTYYYDVQMVTVGAVETLTAAQLTVVADVTRAVS